MEPMELMAKARKEINKRMSARLPQLHPLDGSVFPPWN
jgi:hypothetical protein